MLCGENGGSSHYSAGTVAGQKSKRRSRKRRGSAAAPPAARSLGREQRRERRAAGQAQATRDRRRANRQLGTEGERPPSPFGGLPISEVAIFAGIVGTAVGLIQGGGPALIVGLIVCLLGVVEVTAREHFSGFRSHTSLLAGIPAVGAGIAVIAVFGQPGQRLIVLVVAVPVYGLLFWLLRKRFRRARQARVARPRVP